MNRRRHDDQFAALPWRMGIGVEILLITSRETRRWVIPKGWPMGKLTPAQCAAQEAFEEAGVEGMTEGRPFGHYAYGKRLKNGKVRELMVAVYPLRVGREHADWPEKGEREARWFAAADAADQVAEPGLAELIQTFARLKSGI
jgi:8-oxo-dGTP pyrophosphatase MutT (NUDIX family)